MANEPDVILAENGVEIVGAGASPEVHIRGGNHWNLSESDGDLRIGDEQNMLKVGVSLGGGGAGNARVWATSKLRLGSGDESVVSIDGDGLHPHGDGHSLGSHQARWSGLWLDGDVSVQGSEVELDQESTLQVEGDLLLTGRLAISGQVLGPLVPEANHDLGSPSHRWNTLHVGSVNKASDRRLKTDVEELEGGLEAVLALRPVSYRRRGNGDEAHVGLIGQEVAEVVPEAVSVPEDDAPVGVDYTELVAVLVDAVQSHRAETEALEDRVAEQRSTIEEQEERIGALEERLEALEAELPTGPAAE